MIIFRFVNIFISMKTFIKELLRESLITEIGDLNNPYKKEGAFYFKALPNDFGYESMFTDEIADMFIDIGIYKLDEPNQFSFNFGIDGETQEYTKTDMNHYFRILATVGEVLLQFLSEKQPDFVELSGLDKPNKKGQKDRIYFMVLNKMKDKITSKGYEMVEHYGSPALKKIQN